MLCDINTLVSDVALRIISLYSEPSVLAGPQLVPVSPYAGSVVAPAEAPDGGATCAAGVQALI